MTKTPPTYYELDATFAELDARTQAHHVIDMSDEQLYDVHHITNRHIPHLQLVGASAKQVTEFLRKRSDDAHQFDVFERHPDMQVLTGDEWLNLAPIDDDK